MTRLFNAACLLLALLVMPALALATPVTIGAGQQTLSDNDSANPLLVIQSGSPQTLPAGNYAASLFNYQFTTADPLTTLQGTVEPFLAVSDGTNSYKPIALGNGVTYTGDTAFVSTGFGGSNGFNLADADHRLRRVLLGPRHYTEASIAQLDFSAVVGLWILSFITMAARARPSSESMFRGVARARSRALTISASRSCRNRRALF